MWSHLVKELLRRLKSVIQDKRDDGWRVFDLLFGIALAALLALLLALGWQWSQRTAVVEYDGQIVDRWAGFSESDTGSHPYFKLLVEDNGGKRTTVAVNQEIFARAQVGMRIRNTRSGIELSGKPAQLVPVGP